MGRGLGIKQQEMLSWLQQQWAAGIQPTRNELMGAFVVDKPYLWQWDMSTRDRIRKEQGLDYVAASTAAKQHPDRPPLTDRPTAEGYRRALRTLVDRELVKVVADPDSFYRYCDPEADNPLAVTLNPGRYNERQIVGDECGRRREPEVSASEKRRQTLLQCLPANGNWIEINDLLDAFWLALGYPQDVIDKAREAFAQRQWDGYPLRKYRVNDWLRVALLQLQKAGLAEPGTIAWNGTEYQPKRYGQEKVLAARLCVA
jgi:hypothetical protein